MRNDRFIFEKKKKRRTIKFNSNSLLGMVKENMVDNGLEQRESTNCIYKLYIGPQFSRGRKRIVGLKRFCLSASEEPR